MKLVSISDRNCYIILIYTCIHCLFADWTFLSVRFVIWCRVTFWSHMSGIK